MGGDDLGETLVLRQEAVARVDGIAAGHERRRDDRRRRQVGPRGIGGTDADGLVGELDSERVAIGLAVGDDRLDPRSRQARRIRSAISPRLAMGSCGTSAQPSGAGATAQLDDDELLAVLDRVARLDQAGPDDAVDRGDDLLGTPSMSTAPSRSPARTRCRLVAPARGWKMPTAGDVATTGRLSAPSRPSRRGRRGRGRPASDRRSSGRRVRVRRDAPRGRVARRASLAAARLGGAAQADPPGALADLELARGRSRRAWRSAPAAARRTGGRSRRGRPLARRRAAVGAARRSVGDRIGHSLDLLAGRRFVARPRPTRAADGSPARDPAGRAGDRRGPDRRCRASPAARPQCRTPAPGSVGSGSRRARRSVSAVSAVEPVDDDRLQPPGGLGRVRVGALARLRHDDVDDAELVLVGRGHAHRRPPRRAPRRRSATGSRRSPPG